MGPFLVAVRTFAVERSTLDHPKGDPTKRSESLDTPNANHQVKISLVETIENASQFAFEASNRSQADSDSSASGSLVGVGIVHDPDYRPSLIVEPPTPTERFAAELALAASPGQILISAETHQAVCGSVLGDYVSRSLGQHVILEDYPVSEVFQLDHKDFISTYPPISSIRPILHNLGSRFAPFFGREEDIRQVESMLEESRIVNVVGEPGVGKSSLIWRVALEYCDDMHGGVWRVTCQDDSNRDDLIYDLAIEIQRHTETRQLPQDAIKSAFEGKPGLILFDRCDRAMAGAKEAIQWLLNECGSVSILVTSRTELDIAGEKIYVLKSLGVPTLRTVNDVERLMEYDASRLFIDRMQQFEPKWKPSAEECAAIVDICRQVQGHPASIIAYSAEAASQGVLKVRDVVKSSAGSKSGPTDRHLKQLWGPIEQAYTRLSPESKKLAMRLSMLCADCTANATYGLMDESHEIVHQAMIELSNVSFIEMSVDEHGVVRFALPDHIATYIRAHLTLTEQSDAEQAHLRYYLEIAQDANEGFQGPDVKIALAKFDREYPNIRLALSRAITAKRSEAYVLFASVGNYIIRTRPMHENIELCSKICSETHVKPSPEVARALNLAASIHLMHQSFDRAAALLEQAYEMASEFNEAQVMAMSQSNMLIVRRHNGDMQGARNAGETAIHWFRQAGDKRRLAAILNNLGAVCEDLKDWSVASSCFKESSELSESIGDQWMAYKAKINYVEMECHMGNLDVCINLAPTLLSECESYNDKQSLVWILEDMALAIANLRHWEEAISILAFSDRLREEIGYVRVTGREADIERTFSPFVAQWGADVFEARRISAPEQDVKDVIAWCLLNKS